MSRNTSSMSCKTLLFSPGVHAGSVSSLSKLDALLLYQIVRGIEGR